MTEQKSQEVKIKRDMLIGDAVANYPPVAEIFLKYGLHCVGCHISPYETIEQGAMGHGLSSDIVDNMIKEANEFLEKPVEEQAKAFDLDKADLELTEAAVSKLKDVMKQEKKENAYFRIAVLPGGCSGFSYHFDLEDEKKDGDLIKDKGGIKVLIDTGSLELLNGAKIDYIDTLQGSGFKVENPNATSSCGCGNSFN